MEERVRGEGANVASRGRMIYIRGLQGKEKIVRNGFTIG